jgi:hypothetical protein
LVNGKKDGSPLKKKESLFEKLVDEADAGKLRSWVKDVLIKNKDLELVFIHDFSDRQKQFTPAEVKQLTADAVKAVVKNRLKLEVSEVKKIVALWTDMHNSIVANYGADVTDEKAFLNFHALVESCVEVQSKVHTTYDGINKYN